MATLGDRFWGIIDATVDQDMDAQLEKLQAALEALPLDELVAFDHDFHGHVDRAYRWDLWGAAYLINGGCSDDGFMDFRYWLIAQGRAVYEAALADPESLADHIQEAFASFEEFAYVAAEIYMEATENEIPSDGHKPPRDPEGAHWAEDELNTLFPRLAARVEALDAEEED